MFKYGNVSTYVVCSGRVERCAAFSSPADAPPVYLPASYQTYDSPRYLYFYMY